MRWPDDASSAWTFLHFQHVRASVPPGWSWTNSTPQPTLLRRQYAAAAAWSSVQALLSWQRIRITGHSMTPTLLPGDLVLVRHGAPVRPGALVLARFHSQPEPLV